MIRSILFVCLGNICRSPVAEGVVGARARARGLALRLDSAGTGRWHLGEPPYPPMIRAAAARGYDLTAQRARQVSAGDFKDFDLLLAMDAENLATLQALQPEGAPTPRLFTEALGRPGLSEVPDPYYTRDFDGVLDLVEEAAEALLDQLEAAE